ncbi:MAG: UDP-N-acetylmuramoyl-tripeptide--D-alanyl-D-alanine ligase [bacterium]|nr:UDP-N-acetylmuramoyl-tripeptide--D-alanyl-D-alanine ligase [bacterium]
MESLYVNEIIEATKGQLVKGDQNFQIRSISIDSRSIKKGDLFIAIKGDNFDGHDFIGNAIKSGASGIILSSLHSPLKTLSPAFIIKVSNTLKALQNLAKYYRLKFDIPIIGITGSNGKTTVKDMTEGILSQKLKITGTIGNYNNQVGVPLTAFRLSKDTSAGIFEVGISSYVEMENLGEIIYPDIAVITNINIAHMQYFKTVRGLVNAKAKLLDFVTKEGAVILNADDKYFSFLKANAKCRVISFGIKNKADVMAENISLLPAGTKFLLNGAVKITLPVPGIHNVYNALAAASVSLQFCEDLNLVRDGLRNFKPPEMRMQMIKIKDLVIINDAYNANPASTRAALEVLRNVNSNPNGTKNRKVFIFGNMLELGACEVSEHRKVGKFVTESQIDIFITIGKLAGLSAATAEENGLSGNKIFSFKNTEEVGEKLLSILQSNDTLLLKGSRAMHLENILEILKDS